MYPTSLYDDDNLANIQHTHPPRPHSTTTGPVQHREVQGSESDLFMSYFKRTGGIEYLPGGVASGFKTVVSGTHPTRLLHLKGKRTVRVKEVKLTGASLVKNDVFVLDAGRKIYVFNGVNANKYEKAKGIEVANQIDSGMFVLLSVV